MVHIDATIEDLLLVEGKAELIGGRIIPMMSVGHLPNRVAGQIFYHLFGFALQTKSGNVYTDGVGFAVPQLHSGRQSFSPDVSFYSGPLPKNPMRFIEGPPDFAVEVRSESDYGAAAEIDMAAKRADYFEAGTLVVWDVDTQAKSIHCYRHSAPYTRVVFSLGQVADAEPAVPRWRVAVDEIFR